MEIKKYIAENESKDAGRAVQPYPYPQHQRQARTPRRHACLRRTLGATAARSRCRRSTGNAIGWQPHRIRTED